MADTNKKRSSSKSNAELPTIISVTQKVAASNAVTDPTEINSSKTDRHNYVLETEIDDMICNASIEVLNAVNTAIKDMCVDIQKNYGNQVPVEAIVGGQAFGFAMVAHINRTIQSVRANQSIPPKL